jgi:hypothetical protein
MDTKIIEQYGEDILCYRLRTARQKKRMQYEDFEKHLIHLHKEQKGLWEQRRKLGWEPLIPPVQKGWKRFFVLRDDVERGKHGEFFKNILDKINTKDVSHRKDFLVRRRKYGKKFYVVRGQKLLEPTEDQFRKLEFNDSEKLFFHEEWKLDWGKCLRKHYVFNEPWCFVLRIRPNMIEKVRVRDEALEARIKAIDNYMERNDFEKKQARLLRGHYKRGRCWSDVEKYDEMNPFENWPLERIRDSLKEEY